MTMIVNSNIKRYIHLLIVVLFTHYSTYITKTQRPLIDLSYSPTTLQTTHITA
jgi:hypothetical protein